MQFDLWLEVQLGEQASNYSHFQIPLQSPNKQNYQASNLKSSCLIIFFPFKVSSLLESPKSIELSNMIMTLLFSSILLTYDNLATTIIYDKETLELENVRQMFQNNELIKKTDSADEVSWLVVKSQRGRS